MSNITTIVSDVITKVNEHTSHIDTHMSVPTSYHIYNGSIEATNTVLTNGFSTTLYTGNGSTQSVDTGIDMSTQWGNDVSEKFGGLVWIKSRSNANNNLLEDTVRGSTKRIFTNLTQAEDTGDLVTFGVNGFTLGNFNTSNTSAATYASWNFQTTHRVTGTTNHGKAYTCHYNPFTGFTIIKYEGSGIAGHEIPHHLGRRLGFRVIKNLNSTNDWLVGDVEQDKYLFLSTTSALMTGVGYHNNSSDIVVNLGLLNNANNSSGSSYIIYGWANSYFDEANKLIGNYEVGVYQGTGASGNKVTTRGKPAWIMFKRLDSTGNWYIVDNTRNTSDPRNSQLYPNLSGVESTGTAYNMNFNTDGFTLNGTDIEMNASGGQYLYMVVYDNDSGSGKSKYPRATDTTNLNINALVPYSNGIDTNGSKVSISYKNETISGITLTQGKNYPYSKNEGTYGVSSTSPSYGKDNPLTGDFFNLKTLKWYNSSNVEITPRTYLDCIVYADHNGQVSYVEELPKIEYKDNLKIINGFDLGQTWKNVTASRSAGVTYTNSTGKPIEVAIHSVVSNSLSGIQINVDGLDVVLSQSYVASGTQYTFGNVIVPNGSTYKLTILSGGSLRRWYELR